MSSSDDGPKLLGCLGILAIAGACVFFIGSCQQFHGTRSTVDVVVQKREYVKPNYLIYTDRGVFAINDSVLHGQFDSSDKYGSMVEGKSYRISTYGYRWPVMSWYPIILTIEEVTDDSA